MSKFVWNKDIRRYEKGEMVISPQQVREWITAYQEKTRERLGQIALEFQQGIINRSAWYLETRQAIKDLHGAVSVIANGGLQQMGVKEWGRAGAKIKSEIGYLDGFNSDILNNVAMSEAEMLARARQYANAAFQTFENTVMMRDKDAGVKRILRVLEDGVEHCIDCPDLAGEYDIDDVPEIGDSICQSACKCFYEEIDSELKNCGTGAGGFQEGNTCARGGDGVQEETPSDRAAIARANYKPAEKGIQDHAEANEARLAKGVNGKSLRDNEPMDVIRKTDAALHGIEVKTMVTNANDKITMKASAVSRKVEWAKNNNALLHTVIIDDRAKFGNERLYSGNRLYYRRGVGSFRLSQMTPVKSHAELMRLMDQ